MQVDVKQRDKSSSQFNTIKMNRKIKTTKNQNYL